MQSKLNPRRSSFHSSFGSIPALIVVAVGLIASSANAGVITFTSTRDNVIMNFNSGGFDYSDTNWGGLDYMPVGYLVNGTNKSLVGFTVNDPGLATALTNGALVTSVKLRLYYRSSVFDDSVSTFNHSVYAISAANGDWVEGTGIAYSPSAPDSTWNHKQTGIGWFGGAGLTSAGTSYDSTLLSSIDFNTSSLPGANTAVDFSFNGTSAQLTTLIQNWEVSMPGLLVQSETADPNPTGGVDRILWHTRQEFASGTGAYAPQLIVNFTPEPGSMSLLALGGLALLRRRRA